MTTTTLRRYACSVCGKPCATTFIRRRRSWGWSQEVASVCHRATVQTLQAYEVTTNG